MALCPEHTARARARRLWPALYICEHDSCVQRAVDRHHVDGNPWHNTRSNVRFLCRRHHRVEQVGTWLRQLERAGQLRFAL